MYDDPCGSLMCIPRQERHKLEVADSAVTFGVLQKEDVYSFHYCACLRVVEI